MKARNRWILFLQNWEVIGKQGTNEVSIGNFKLKISKEWNKGIGSYALERKQALTSTTSADIDHSKIKKILGIALMQSNKVWLFIKKKMKN